MMKNSKMKTFSFSAMLFVAAMLFATTAMAEIAIIANTGSGASELNASTAKKLFLGKLKSIDGIAKVTVVGQVDDSPIKEEFTKKITKKSLSKFKAYWSKKIFSGKAVPPKELENDAEVKAYVAGHADAVGYIDAASVDSTVKVLFRAP